MAHSSSPALHANDRVTLVKNAKLDGIHDTPLEAAVDIFLPWRALEVGLGLGEVEGVNTTVQMRVLQTLVEKSIAPLKDLPGQPLHYE